jgi:hypothetical protein
MAAILDVANQLIPAGLVSSSQDFTPPTLCAPAVAHLRLGGARDRATCCGLHLYLGDCDEHRRAVPDDPPLAVARGRGGQPATPHRRQCQSGPALEPERRLPQGQCRTVRTTHDGGLVAQ